MAEPFKNELGEARIKVIASHLSKNNKSFNNHEFLLLALENLDELSLMQRSQQIVSALKQCLPDNFIEATDIIINSLSPVDNQVDEHGLHSWLTVPLAEFMGQHGQHEFEHAMFGLRSITQYFSSEWAIRHFLKCQQQDSLHMLHKWCEHENEHVRRLVSEGSRPRLPWGFQLEAFKQDPTLTFPLLEKLKNDPSDYVRLSVSNHLNDISKDHPEWLVENLKPWVDEHNDKRMKLIRHACRSLIKMAHQPTLDMLGYTSFKASDIELNIKNHNVIYGEKLEFDLSFIGPKNKPIIVDFIIHFKKSNGQLAPKVFKWKTASLNSKGQFNAKKSHGIKPITTRRYYNGQHKLEVMVNGRVVAEQDFELSGVQ